ncbi:MAG: hypothetical protein II881_02930, partial [Oscillospiraceae bacterium]|nr:hypothetical protein [Oscillospiraceae bacterium]
MAVRQTKRICFSQPKDIAPSVGLFIDVPVFFAYPLVSGKKPDRCWRSSWDSNPSEDLSEAPSLAATVLPLGLGLDASIIVGSKGL